MRTATEMPCKVSVSGELLETPRLKASLPILMENEKVFKGFVDSLAENGDRLNDLERTKGHYYWEHVSSDSVAQLLRDFETHPWHLSFNGRALAEFIESKTWNKGWDVVLINSGEGCAYPGGLKCGDETLTLSSTEKRRISVDTKMLSVSGTKVRVGSGGCTRIGLTSGEIEEAKRIFKKETGKTNASDKAYLTRERAPILMLHVLEADYGESAHPELPAFLFALGVGFPKDDYGTSVATYKVNLVELRNWIEIPDESDEEEYI